MSTQFRCSWCLIRFSNVFYNDRRSLLLQGGYTFALTRWERERESKSATKLIITDPHKFTLNEGIFSTITVHTFNFNTPILYNGIHFTGEISGFCSESAKDSDGSESDAVSWVTLGVFKPLPSFKASGSTKSHSVTSQTSLIFISLITYYNRLATGQTVWGPNPGGWRDFPHISKSTPEPTQPSVQWIQVLFLGGKAVGT
jgi:hypothetical protein